MYEFFVKRGTAVAFGVGALISLIHLALAYSGNPGAEGDSSIDFGLYASYALVGIGVLAMLIGVGKYFMENPSQLKTLIGFAVLFAVVGVFIMMASDQAPAALQPTMDEMNVSPAVYKYVNGGVNATVFILVLAFLGLIVSEVSSLFK